MSKNKVLQKVAGSILLASVVMGGYMGKAYAEAPVSPDGGDVVSSYSEEPGINSRKAQTVWVYKEIEGLKFMRLYDATNEKYLTPWIWIP